MMDKWSNRYAHNQGASRAGDPTRGDRIRTIVLILLAVALVGVTIVGGQAMAFRSKAHDTFIYRMRTECNQAVDRASLLSRNNGSETPEILGEIRAHVHSVDAINEMHSNLHGGDYLIPAQTFDTLETLLASFSQKLRNGSPTIDVQAELISALDALRTSVAALD